MSDAVAVAIIGTIGLVVASAPALITALSNRRDIRKMSDTVGTRNGHDDDLVTMIANMGTDLHRHEDSDAREFDDGRKRFKLLEEMLKERTPVFDRLAEELAELNGYSHETKHTIVNKLTALSGYVQLL
jgi:hypothetical protein